MIVLLLLTILLSYMILYPKSLKLLYEYQV